MTPTYESIVAAWGYTVTSWYETGDYRGNYVVGLSDGERRGYTVIGYGSCSGCDALQAVYGHIDSDDPAEVAQAVANVAALSERLKGCVRWFDTSDERRDAVINALALSGGTNDWYYHDDEVRSALCAVVADGHRPDEDDLRHD